MLIRRSSVPNALKIHLLLQLVQHKEGKLTGFWYLHNHTMIDHMIALSFEVVT